MIYPTLAHFRHFSHSFNYNIFPMHSIMQNKPNFGNDKMNINLDMTSNYEILSCWRGKKTNPIQTQLKPKQTQFKPNKAKNKANSNPIWRKGKNERFCVERNLTMILIMLLVDFTTLKGANFFTPLFRVQGLFWCICVRLSALLNRRVELVWESTE